MNNQRILAAAMAGELSTILTKNEGIGACNSCVRGVLYSALAALGGVIGALNEGASESAHQAAVHATRVLVGLAREDFRVSLKMSEAYEDDEWEVAKNAFLDARIQQFVDPETGLPISHHGEDDGLAGDRAEVR